MRRGDRGTRWPAGPAALALVATLVGCGDDGTGPDEDTVEFPTVPPAVQSQYCIRGTGVPPTNLNGTIEASDCATVFPVGAGPDSHYETYRIRVASTGSFTFEVTSGFDSYLDLFVITNVGSPTLGLNNLVAFDDDSGDDLDARMTAQLVSGTEYWLMISGFEAEDLGSYGLSMTVD